MLQVALNQVFMIILILQEPDYVSEKEGAFYCNLRGLHKNEKK
jgi:hypothetical protein